MHSMTGFGQAVTETEAWRVEVRIRCVNHRFLDLSLRLPEEFRDRETLVRKMIAGRLHRGRVEVRLDIDDERDREVRARVSKSFVAALREVGAELEREGLTLGRLELSDLLRVPNAVRISAAPAAEDLEFDQKITATVDKALDQVEQARATEGARLSAALAERLEALEVVVREISARQVDVQQQLSAKYRQRLQDLVADSRQLDDDRIALEIAVLAERSDVAEELDRLVTHQAHFREVMSQDGAVGKRLDFIAQEIFRELTTLASKCRQTDALQGAIEAKLLCEQLREQIQNIE